jgi:DNA invertase Pin-like site-specific DNA recombinase
VRKYVVAKYIRLSIDDKQSESMSVENQRLILDDFVNTMPEENIRVLEFVDNGQSGTNFERPAFQELLNLARQGKIDCLCIKDFSRFGRNSLESGYFIEQIFPLYGIRFIAVTDNFDSDDFKGTTGGIEVAFKALLSEQYSRDLSRKIKSAKRSKMLRGEHQSGRCLYGYKKGADGKLEVDETAAENVRLIFNMFLHEKKIKEIQKELLEKRVPTPGEYSASQGKKVKGHAAFSEPEFSWDRSKIRSILGDEQYIGTYVAGKCTSAEVGSRKFVRKEESEWIKIPNHHPAIIEKETFNAVQEKLRKLKRGNPGRKPKAQSYPSATRDILEATNRNRLNKEAANVMLEEQNEQERQFMDAKRLLYERFVLHEVNVDSYMTQKAELETEYQLLKQRKLAFAASN